MERHPGFNPATRLTLSSSSKKKAAATDEPELDEIEQILQECGTSDSKEMSKLLPKPAASVAWKKTVGAKLAGEEDDAGGFSLFCFGAMEASATASGEQQGCLCLPPLNSFSWIFMFFPF